MSRTTPKQNTPAYVSLNPIIRAAYLEHRRRQEPQRARDELLAYSLTQATGVPTTVSGVRP